uniref:Uncharacterized protein n=1 Tax=Timema genevievae TaxID=629358 RepID=A0A7R9PLR5_TIMGE|nr:unnamed protein product [Timema genevievae]
MSDSDWDERKIRIILYSSSSQPFSDRVPPAGSVPFRVPRTPNPPGTPTPNLFHPLQIPETSPKKVSDDVHDTSFGVSVNFRFLTDPVGLTVSLFLAGWTNDVHVPPSTKDRPLCVEARRLFPCQHSYYSSAEDGSLCGANYFYWDIEDCAVSHTHPYICEKPHLDIGCVAGVGQEYAGAANVTINGMPCIHWDLEEVVPYLRFKVSEAERTMSLTGHNYCRNVGGTEGHPWCFVGPRGMMELCDIPTCFNSGAKQTSANTSRCGPKQFECAPAECIASAWVCDGEKDCSNGHDEQSCTGYLEEFSYHGSKRLEGHNVEKWLHTDVNTCAKHCLEALEFTCLSFSFHDRDGVCLLSDSNVGLTGHLRQLQEWEYYELKSKSIHCDNNFTCDNQKCISASSTRVSRGRKKVGESVPATLVAVERKDVPAT